jgi:hypothetical protein
MDAISMAFPCSGRRGRDRPGGHRAVEYYCIEKAAETAANPVVDCARLECPGVA